MSKNELLAFLENRRDKVLKEIIDRGEDIDKLYEKILEMDDEDKYKASLAFAVRATKDDNTHMMWMNIWSKDENEVSCIEAALDKQEWKDFGDRAYIGDHLSLAFKKENKKGERFTGLEAQLIYNQQKEFTNKTYHDKAAELLNKVIGLLKHGQEAKTEPEPTEFLYPEDVTIKMILDAAEKEKKLGIMVGDHEGYITIFRKEVDTEIEVEIEGVKNLDINSYAEDKEYSVRAADNGNLLIKRTFSELPNDNQMRIVANYAKKLLESLDKSD